MNAKSTWKKGEKVVGTYLGQQFSGVLNDNCRPTPDYKNVIFGVTLDIPISVYGTTRKTVEVWSNCSNSSIQAA